MRTKGIYAVAANSPLTPCVWRMTLEGDTSALCRAGQFVALAVEGLFLRRPISVCDYDDRSITIIYKVVGEGTERLTHLRRGDTVDILSGLGNGFDVRCDVRRPLVAGGGVGVPPLYNLTRRLVAAGQQPTVVLGFNTRDEIFYAEEFRSLGVRVVVATADGSEGVRGFVTDAIREEGIEADYFYACGPRAMLRALCEMLDADGQISMEERMGCGFGACMGCTCKTKSGFKRVCREGPVFGKEEILW